MSVPEETQKDASTPASRGRAPEPVAPEGPGGVSPAMDRAAAQAADRSEADQAELERIRRLMEQSRDRENPDPLTLQRLLRRLRRLAVVGISRDPRKPARRVPSYLAAKGLDVIPVNPHAEWLLGRPVRVSLSAVSEKVDLVLVFRPSGEAGAVVREAAQRPERPVIWLQRGILAPEAAAEVRAAGGLVIQDACLFEFHRALEENRPRPFHPPVTAGAG